MVRTETYKCVAIADDHIMMRKGTVAIINTFSDFKVIIEADNGKELIDAIEESQKIPDIAIVDIHMPIMNGYETVSTLKSKWESINVLVLTMINDEYAIIRMLRSGAKGYILKASHPDDLYKGLTEVYNGNYYSTDVVTGSVYKAISVRRNGYLFPELTEMELQVVSGYCKGFDNKSVAKELGVSHRTIDTYRNSLFEKLGVSNRVELVMFALRNGLATH